MCVMDDLLQAPGVVKKKKKKEKKTKMLASKIMTSKMTFQM